MRPRTNPLSEQNIKRIDTRPGSPKQTHGFQVYICRQGTVHTKHFSDRAMGGQKKALKAARAHRDALLEELPPQELIRISHTRNARNTSGHVGVSFRERSNLKGSVVRYICVSVRPERGKGINRSFRYTKATKSEVLKEALAFRESVIARRLHEETGLSVRKAKALSKKANEVGTLPAKPTAKRKRAASKPAPKAKPDKKAAAKKATAKKAAAKKPAAKKSPKAAKASPVKKKAKATAKAKSTAPAKKAAKKAVKKAAKKTTKKAAKKSKR